MMAFSKVFGKIRVQAFNENIIRIEYDKNSEFCDENTFFIPDKNKFAGCDFEVNETLTDVNLVFPYGELLLPKKARGLNGVKFSINGKTAFRYRRSFNDGELPKPNTTPDVFAIYDAPQIILPCYYGKGAKGKFSVKEGAQDVYLLICKKDASLLRKLYVSLTGKSELPRLSVFGLWDSRYYKNTNKSVRERVKEYLKRGVPLDVFVFDTDWRTSEDGTGYRVDRKLFPDIKNTISCLHRLGIETVFNDHPKPVKGCKNMFSVSEIAYREKKLRYLLEKGADILWYDRNWTTHLISPTKKVKEETFGMYAFYDITERFYSEKNIFLRPVIMGNVNNIWHGLYRGKGQLRIKDAASHRYPVQWTGDIGSSDSSLYAEIKNLTGASENCVSYINFDCGGHNGELTAEKYLRWMQFGCFTPVLRPHCSNEVKVSKEPWAYGEETFKTVKDYIELRYRLLPYLYGEVYKNYADGRPIFKSLAYLFPKDKNAVNTVDEYFFGDDLIIAPIYSKIENVVEKENFIGKVKCEYFIGEKTEGVSVCEVYYDDLFLWFEREKPHVKVPTNDFSARFTAKLRFKKDVFLSVASCGNGITVFIDGKEIHRDNSAHFVKKAGLCKMVADKTHDIKIEYYYKDKGDAVIGLFYETDSEADENNRKIYLPRGEWVYPFNGKVYSGRNYINGSYEKKEFPIFVKKGAVIPLAYNAKNTKEQSWKRMVFDYYPSKMAKNKNYLYEDDGKTVAYKKGCYCLTEYRSFYDKENKKFVVVFRERKGKFDGERYFNEREIVLKIHFTDEIESVKSVKINGIDGKFSVSEKDVRVMPFSMEECSPDGKCAVVKATLDLQKDNVFEIYI